MRHLLTLAVFGIGGLGIGFLLAPLDGRHSWPLFTVFVVACGYFSRSLGVVILGCALASAAFWSAFHWSVLFGWRSGGPDHNAIMAGIGAVVFFIPWAIIGTTSFAAGQWVRRLNRDQSLCAKCGYDLRGRPPHDSATCPECGAVRLNA